MAKSALEAKIAEARAEIARLENIVAFLTADGPVEPEAEAAPKKTRKKRTPRGLPAEQQAASGF